MIKFFTPRRCASLLTFIAVFGFMWITIFFYVSTWDNDILDDRHSRLRQNLAGGRFLNLFDDAIRPQNEFIKRKSQKIEKYRELFGLEKPGDMGKPVILPEELPADVKKQSDEGWKLYTINEFVSDLIPLRRRLPDIRDDYCKSQVYEEELPKASVIIIFHNEAWSMILRTMHSVLDRSPDDLLEEIIFIDDFSDRGLGRNK